jgi:Fe-S-cluster containining protein
MQAAQEDFNFSCLGCGKCCDSPPQLSVREMYKHLDDFVLHASILTQPVQVPSSLAKRIGPTKAFVGQMTSKRSFELGAITFRPQSIHGEGPEMLATVSGASLPFSHIRRCTALQDDNKCGIYDHRPNTCRYVPGQHLLDEDSQDVAFSIFRGMHANDCDWSVSAPLVVKAGCMTDANMTEAFKRAEADDRMDSELLRSLLDAGDVITAGDGEMSIEVFVNDSLAQGEVKIPIALFTVFLQALKDRGELPAHYDVPSTEEVAWRQSAVCERLIANNLAKKNKDARSHTESLRFLLGLNKSFAADII